MRGIAEAERTGTSGTYGYYVRENGIDIAFELGDTATATQLARGRPGHRHGRPPAVSIRAGPVDPVPGRHAATHRPPGASTTCATACWATRSRPSSTGRIGWRPRSRPCGPAIRRRPSRRLGRGSPSSRASNGCATPCGSSGWLPGRWPTWRPSPGLGATTLVWPSRWRPPTSCGHGARPPGRACRHGLAASPAAEVDAELATIDAELARAAGEPSSALWAAAADRWRDRQRPYLRGLRRLAGGRGACSRPGERGAAGCATGRGGGHRPADGHATRCCAAIEGLAARARIALDADGVAPEATAGAPGHGAPAGRRRPIGSA